MTSELNFSRRRKLPIIVQSEAMECGLASLAMIAKYHGHDLDLNGLRQRFSISLKGAPLEAIINLAAQLDLGARALRLEIEEIDQLQTPCILHWDLNHYVVLKKVTGRKVHIHDPATGLKVMSLRDFSTHFTGVALELTPTARFEKQDIRRKMHLSQLWGRLVGLKRAMLQLLALSLILQFIVLASPFYLQLVVDEAITKFDSKILIVLAIGFGALTIIQQITKMMRDWTILYYGHQMSFQLIANVFNHLINLPVGYFEKRHVGDILSRLSSTNPIKTALTQSVVAAVIDGFMAVITGIVIFVYSPVLGLIVFASVILLLLCTIVFYPILRRAQESMILSEAKESTHKIESIRAFVPIKLFSAQNQRMSVWRNLFASYINSSVAYGKHQIVLNTLQGLIINVQVILIVYFGANIILSNPSDFTVGMLFAFMSFRASFTNSAVSLFNKFIEFRLLGLHLERIADIAHAETEKTDVINTPSMDTYLDGDIELKNVRFRYSPADPWVLDGVNLKIKLGDFVALTGPSGGGKTTLLKLILGLYKPTEGEILVGGQPLTDMNRILWRKSIGVVMQDDQLLSGTLADNISFFDPQTDMVRVREAAQKAQVHKEISAMPMEYLSLIGDMGSALSGGQKQRVLLARALYRMPKVLCLDEGTANLDEKTEKTIVDVISKLPLTRIAIAHRPEFLKRATTVIEVG